MDSIEEDIDIFDDRSSGGAIRSVFCMLSINMSLQGGGRIGVFWTPNAGLYGRGDRHKEI
ncbi:MAG: hypothetical protein ACJZ79_01420 [Pseudohongiellaceae bacterium]